MDGTIPTSQLPEVLRRTQEMAAAANLQVANIFHAGDGNLHPLIMFDANDPASLHKAEILGADLLKLCVEVGGCLTGEHGVGVEKRDLMHVQFEPHELEQQRRIKSAFDPDWLLNPSKVFPLAERRRSPPPCCRRPHDPACDVRGHRSPPPLPLPLAARETAAGGGQRHQIRADAPGAGGAHRVHRRPLRHHAVCAERADHFRARRDPDAGDRGDAGRGRAVHDRRTARPVGAARTATASRRPWAASSPPICPARAASPAGRSATTSWASARSTGGPS